MENVPAEDWHVMVVDTDGQWGGTDCTNACMSLGVCPDEPSFPCDTPPPQLCDISLGAGHEPDDHSLGDPADWADAVIAAKGGVPESVVVLGLVPDGDLGMPLCGSEAVLAPRLTEFLQLFDSSSRASICEPDYSPFFLDAVSVISVACDEFEPIG